MSQTHPTRFQIRAKGEVLTKRFHDLATARGVPDDFKFSVVWAHTALGMETPMAAMIVWPDGEETDIDVQPNAEACLGVVVHEVVSAFRLSQISGKGSN